MRTLTVRDALATLRLSQSHLCRVLDCDKSTVNRWATGAPIPAAVAFLLTACVTGKLTLADLERMHLDRMSDGGR